uniref:SET domain-containing protein n=1 Tax=Panagrellus redivivus TaxID=6233 RepID=A0A7E4ZXA4_PANRE
MDEYSDDFATQRSSHYNGISPMLAQPDDDDDRFDHFNGLGTDPDGNKLDLALGSSVADDLDEQMQVPGPSFMDNGMLNNSQDEMESYGLDIDREDFHRSDLDLSANDSMAIPTNVSSSHESIDSSAGLPAKAMEYAFASRPEYIEVATSSATMAPTDFLAVDESYLDTGDGESSMLAVQYDQTAISNSQTSFHTAISMSQMSIHTAIEPESSISCIQITSETNTAIEQTPTSSSIFPESAQPSSSTETAIEPPRCPTPTGFLPDGQRLSVLEPGPDDDRAAWNAKILSKMIQPKLHVDLDPKIYKKLKESRQLPDQIRKDKAKRKRKAEKRTADYGIFKGQRSPPPPEKSSKRRRNMASCIVCNEGVDPADSGLAPDSLYCSLACIKNMVERCRPCCLPNENITFTNAANELAQLPKKTIVTISTLGVFLQAKPMLKPFVNFAKLQETTSKSTAAPIKAEKDLKDEDRIRNNVKMNIREQLMNRAKALKIGVSRIAVTKLSEQIEVELYRVHKYAKAKRYKEWVQDFFAQILTDDNMFFKKVVTNGYTAQKLVLMKKDEMYISPEADTTPAKPIAPVPKFARKRLPTKPVLSAVDKILGEEGADTTLKHNSHEYDSNCQICAKNTAARRAALEQAEKDREEEMEERKRRKLMKEKEREERASRPRFEKPVHHHRKVEDDFDDIYDGFGGGNDDFRPVSPPRTGQSSRWNDFKPVSPRASSSGSRWDYGRDRGFDSRRRNDSEWRRDNPEPSYDRGYSLSPGSPPPAQPPAPMNRPMSPREMTPPPGVSPDRLAVKHVSQREPTPDFSRDISPDPYAQRGFPARGGPPRPMPPVEGFFGPPRAGAHWTPGMPEPHMNGRPYDDRPPPHHTLESWRREEQWRREGRPGTPPFRPDYFADGPAHSYYNTRPGHPGHPGPYGRPVSPILRPSPPPMGRPFDYDHRPGVPGPHGHPMYPNGPPMPHPMERRGPPGGPWPDMRRGATPEFVLEPPVEPHSAVPRTAREASHVPSVWNRDPTIFTGTVSGATFDFRCTMRVISNPAAFELRDRFPNPLLLKARVRPEPMWNFLKSVKHIRRFQTIIATVNITSPMDAEPYFECFNNLKRTSRYAVFDIPADLGIKEAYLFYLDAGEPLPPILLPVDGPGLPSSPDSKGSLCAVIVKYAEVKPAIANEVTGASPASSMKSHGTPSATAQTNGDNGGQVVEHRTLEEVLVAIEHILDPNELIAVVKAFIQRGGVTDKEKAILQNKCQAKIEEQRRMSSVAVLPPPSSSQSDVPPPSSGQPKDETAPASAAPTLNADEGPSSVAAMSSGSVKGDSESISASHTMSDLIPNPPPPPPEVPIQAPASVIASEPEEGQLRDEDAMDISDGEITSPTPMDFILPPPPPPPSSEALAPPPPPPPPLPAAPMPFDYEGEPTPPCSGMFNPPIPPRPAFPPPPRPTMGFFNNSGPGFFNNDAPPLHMAEVEGPPRGRGRGRGGPRGRGRGGLPPGGPRGPGPMPFPNRFPPPPNWQGPPGGVLPPQEDAFMFHGGGMPPRAPIPLSAVGTRPPRAFRGGRGRGRGGGPPRGHF